MVESLVVVGGVCLVVEAFECIHCCHVFGFLMNEALMINEH